jgi:transcriptional repressor NrdR
MDCPYCGSDQIRVVETRSVEGSALRRRRRCLECKRLFSTVERLDAAATAGGLRVEERSGIVVPFNLDRIRTSIREALDNSPYSPALEEVVDAVVARVGEHVLTQKSGNKPIQVEDIGIIVLAELTRHRGIFAVSRIRYALGMRTTSREVGGFQSLDELKHWLDEHWPYGELKPEQTQRAKPQTIVRKRPPKANQPWDHAKLERSIRIAAKGRDDDSVQQLAESCANYVREELSDQSIVTTEQISTEVMKLLRRQEPIAYLRYASVAKRFRTAREFRMEMEDLERGGLSKWSATDDGSESIS